MPDVDRPQPPMPQQKTPVAFPVLETHPGEVYVGPRPGLHRGAVVFPATVDPIRENGRIRASFRPEVAQAVLNWLNQPALDSDGRYILGSEGGWALAAPDNIDTSVLQDAQRLVPVGDEELVAVADSPAFPAYVDPTQRWNGWLVPYFRPEVAEVVVAWTVEQHVRDQEACPDVFYWDHGRLVHLDAQYSGYDGHMPDWADPTDSRGGRICIGGYAWTWERAVPPPQTPAPLLPPRGQDQRQKSDPAAPTPSLSSETRTASDSHTGPRHHR